MVYWRVFSVFISFLLFFSLSQQHLMQISRLLSSMKQRLINFNTYFVLFCFSFFFLGVLGNHRECNFLHYLLHKMSCKKYKYHFSYSSDKLHRYAHYTYWSFHFLKICQAMLCKALNITLTKEEEEKRNEGKNNSIEGMYLRLHKTHVCIDTHRQRHMHHQMNYHYMWKAFN